MTIRRFDNDDPAIAEFLAAHPHTVFQRPLWNDVLGGGLRVPTFYYALVDEAGRPELVLPGARMNLWVLRLFYAGIPYGGFVGPADRIGRFMDEAPAALRSDGVHAVRIARGYYDAFVDVPRCRKAPATQHVLHFGDRSADEVWSGFKRRVRRDVRKATNRWGVTVRDVTGPDDIARIDALYADTIRRNHTFRVWTPRILERILNEYVLADRGAMLVAVKDDRILACLLVLFDDDRKVCHGLMGVSDRETLVMRPNDLLMWTAMERSIERGLVDFDFMTTRAGDEELVGFKDKWGAACYEFAFYEMDLSPRAALWQRILRFSRTPLGSFVLRHLWRH